jgi:hypothetical protein
MAGCASLRLAARCPRAHDAQHGASEVTFVMTSSSIHGASQAHKRR